MLLTRDVRVWPRQEGAGRPGPRVGIVLARGSPLHILAAAVGGGTREGTQQFIGGSATEGALQPFPLPEIRTVSGADCCPAALPADDGGVVGGPSPTVGPRDALMAEAGAHPVASPLSGSVPLVLPPGGRLQARISPCSSGSSSSSCRPRLLT